MIRLPSNTPNLRVDPPLADRFGREAALGGPAGGLAWVTASGTAQLVAAAGDGVVRAYGPGLKLEAEHPAHGGAILGFAVCGDRPGVVTGGDDGRVVRWMVGAAPETIAESGGRWIDHVATAADGTIAWSEGKRAVVLTGGIRTVLDHPSTVGGLAFDPDGKRLAAAHYGGASVWDLADQKRKLFGWKGSHVGALFSPNGRFLITVMQENALHGWRLSDGGNMRMAGYPAKPKSLSFSANGNWMATSGAESAVLWPFKGKDGPMGKGGEALGQRPAIVTAVAWHPRSEVLAIGYSDGCVLLARRAEQGTILVKSPRWGVISHLAWSPDGSQLAYATEPGGLGLVDIAAASK